MKRIVLLIALVFQLAIIQSPVYSASDEITAIDKFLQEGKVKIKKEELPESVKKTLGGDNYKGWSIVNIYKTKDAEYEVEMKKGDTTQALKFDKEGKVK